MGYGQAQARDRATGQGSLFDMLGDDADSGLAQRLPTVTEAPPRERLRWEKELLGLYLSDHPLGELAEEMGGYVDTWTGDIGADLDQERVVVGGMAVGIRRVITRNKESMAVVTLEDMQGPVDVVIFPRTYADAGVAAKLTEDTVLLVAGRVDHKGDETVVLADSVWTWEEATAKGRDVFTQEVAAGNRGRRGGRRRNGNGSGRGNGNADANGLGRGANTTRQPAPSMDGGSSPGVATTPAPRETLVVPRVSPLRGSQPDGTITVTIGGPPAGRTMRSLGAVRRCDRRPAAAGPPATGGDRAAVRPQSAARLRRARSGGIRRAAPARGGCLRPWPRPPRRGRSRSRPARTRSCTSASHLPRTSASWPSSESSRV